MLYFFHHFELPVIIQQAQLQQLLIRNRHTMNQQQQQQQPAGGPRARGPNLRIPLPVLLPFIRQRLNNDNNNNMNEFLRGTLNVMNRMASVLRGQIRVTLNVRRNGAGGQENDGGVGGTGGTGEGNDNAVEGTQNRERPREEGTGENSADTRSNFQRNYEENNFLFPPDILMRERDRVTTSQPSVNNNQASPLSNVNNSINNHHRHHHHENLAETLYSVAPIPGRIELTTTPPATTMASSSGESDSSSSASPVANLTQQEQLSQINRDTLIKTSEIVVSTENHQILEPNVISGESNHDDTSSSSSSNSRNNYCNINNKEIHNNEQQETNNTSCVDQHQQQQNSDSSHSHRMKDNTTADDIDDDDEDDNKHDEGGGTSQGNNVTL